jgi:Sec-independent protein translocase protein TatA
MEGVEAVSRYLQIVVGVVGLLLIIFGAGKAWAALTSTMATLKALHERLDKITKEFRDQISELRESNVEIRTVLRLRPTIRFRPLAEEGGHGPQDVFKEGDEG